MRSLISFFIKNHVSVNVIVIGFIVFGSIRFLGLNSSYFPLEKADTIRILVQYPSASAQEIEEGIILKIEQQLKGLQGVDEFTASCQENTGSVIIKLDQDQNIDTKLLEVKNAIDRISGFPIGMEPLVVQKIDFTRPTISLALYETSGKTDIKNLKKESQQIKLELQQINGISQVAIEGIAKQEIEIEVQTHKLQMYELGMEQISRAIKEFNILSTAGSITTQNNSYLIRSEHKKYLAKDFKNCIVKKSKDGSIVYLKDIANLKDQFETTPNNLYYNGKKSLQITVTSTNTEDLISSAKKAKKYVENYNKNHQNTQLKVTRDLSITLEQRTSLLLENAIIGMILVLLFLSVFLNGYAALWVAFGLPIAFLGMFICIGYFNVTINVLSLFGMIIVIGILVDDGIVIAENIYKHLEQGKSPIKASIEGTLEVIPPILSAILTTILSFTTFLFLDGQIGMFFGEISIVVIITLLISLVEALFILPAHLAHSKGLKKSKNNSSSFFINRWIKQINQKGQKLMNFLNEKLYTPCLKFSLEFPVLTLLLFIIPLILTIASIKGKIIGISLFPRIASDRINIELVMPQGTPLKKTQKYIEYIEDKAWEVNNELTQKYFLGKDFQDKQLFKNYIRKENTDSQAKLYINLLAGEERPKILDADFVTKAIKEKVGNIPQAKRIIFGSNRSFGGSPVSVSLQGNIMSELKKAKKDVLEVIEKDPRLTNITDNDPEGLWEIKLELLPKAHLLGFSIQELTKQIREAFYGKFVQRFQYGEDEIKIWIRLPKEERNQIAQLDNFWLQLPNTSKGNKRVSFKEIATYQLEKGQVNIQRINGIREIQINAGITNPKEATTDLLNELEKGILKQITQKHPSVSYKFGGQNKEAKKIGGSSKTVVPCILFLIYLCIAFTFKSYSQPALLLIMIPFSLIAVAWGHYLHDFNINVLSALGIIALIGIMVNDGLVYIECYNNYLKKGYKIKEALFESGKARFRAIFLTSATTIAGLTPLIFEKSRQAQFLKPMAIAIAYGISLATLLTLILLPVLLNISNYFKYLTAVLLYRITGKKDYRKLPKESVERAVKELKYDEEF